MVNKYMACTWCDKRKAGAVVTNAGVLCKSCADIYEANYGLIDDTDGESSRGGSIGSTGVSESGVSQRPPQR